MSKTKSNLITIEKVRGKWSIVGRESGNCYTSGTRFDCCWKMSQPDNVAYWETLEQEAINQWESEKEYMQTQNEWLQSDGFGEYLEAEKVKTEKWMANIAEGEAAYYRGKA
jgi:hypothetical protein